MQNNTRLNKIVTFFFLLKMGILFFYQMLRNSLVLDYSCWHLRRTLSFPFYWTGSEKFSLFASCLFLCWTSLSPLTTASQILQKKLIMHLFIQQNTVLYVQLCIKLHSSSSKTTGNCQVEFFCFKCIRSGSKQNVQGSVSLLIFTINLIVQ